MNPTRTARTWRPALTLALVAFLVACAGSRSAPAPAGPARAAAPAPGTANSTADPRVRSFVGRTPPDVFTDGTWVGPAGPTSLAAERGRVVYLQFAFPQ